MKRPGAVICITSREQARLYPAVLLNNTTVTDCPETVNNNWEMLATVITQVYVLGYRSVEG